MRKLAFCIYENKDGNPEDRFSHVAAHFILVLCPG